MDIIGRSYLLITSGSEMVKRNSFLLPSGIFNSHIMKHVLQYNLKKLLFDQVLTHLVSQQFQDTGMMEVTAWKMQRED